MSGMGMMGPAWRSLRSDRSVVNETIDRRTVRRVLGFARPHRRLITGFLALTVIDSCLVVVTPLLMQRIVDDGILKGNHTLVTVLALGMVAVALVGALLAIGSGYLSSRIGEGLIFDLRTRRVRPRPASVAGVLHPHPDRCAGLAAQQRRHRRAARLHLDPVERRLQHRSPCSSSASPCSP